MCFEAQFFIILKGLQNTHRNDLSRLKTKLHGFHITIDMNLFSVCIFIAPLF